MSLLTSAATFPAGAVARSPKFQARRSIRIVSRRATRQFVQCPVVPFERRGHFIPMFVAANVSSRRTRLIACTSLEGPHPDERSHLSGA